MDLSPAALRNLLDKTEREQALCHEQAVAADKLARLLEQRYIELEEQRQALGLLFQRLCDAYDLYDH